MSTWSSVLASPGLILVSCPRLALGDGGDMLDRALHQIRRSAPAGAAVCCPAHRAAGWGADYVASVQDALEAVGPGGVLIIDGVPDLPAKVRKSPDLMSAILAPRSPVVIGVESLVLLGSLLPQLEAVCSHLLVGPQVLRSSLQKVRRVLESADDAADKQGSEQLAGLAVGELLVASLREREAGRRFRVLALESGPAAAPAAASPASTRRPAADLDAVLADPPCLSDDDTGDGDSHVGKRRKP